MRKLLLSIFLLFSVSTLWSQDNMILYDQQDIPQSAYTNPANRFEGKFFVGIPALSSVEFGLSNRFSYSDAIVKSGDSLKLSFGNLIGELKDYNYLNFSSRIDLLSFGINLGDKTQLMFNISEVANLNFGISKDLVKFIYQGNAAFENRSADFSGMGINATHYREYGVSASHQLNDKWRLGARFKYLYGMENIYTEKMDVQFTTEPETYALRAETDFAIRTSGFGLPDDLALSNPEGESFMEYMSGRDNHGMAFDLGAHYQFNKKLNLSASIVDLGYINWNESTYSYFGNGSFTYDGIEINSFAVDPDDLDPNDPRANDDTSFDRVLDSLESDLGIEQGKGSYTSPLVTKVFMSANYLLNDRSYAGLLIKNNIFRSKLRPSFSLTYGRRMNRWLSLSASYSGLNSTFDNLGLGASFNPGPLQFYIVSDNVFGFFKPQHARNFHIRLGVNLIFGRDKDQMKINSGDSHSSRPNRLKRKL